MDENLLKPGKVGEIIEGKVIAKESGKLFLDLGPIGTGIIYGREFYEAKDKIKDLKIGDNLFAKIINLENDEGYIELSISRAGMELSLEALKQKKEKGEKIIVKIKGANKGGLLTEAMGIPAFLPVSQLLPEHYPRVEKGDTSKILRELQKFVGKTLEVKILDLSHKGEQIILSEKAKELDKVKEILKNYKVGDLVEGEITGITDFGAFFRFGTENLEGLIHISELDWKIIEDPTEIVKVGDVLQAKIIDISGDKVSLSLKALKKDPWQNIEKKYKKGDIVSGKVIKFNPFGAFVQLSPEIQGLCHISEFGTKAKMEKKLKIGKKYDFQILEIRPQEHRLSLKLVEV
ncbi:MAG: S1 RNA-binding domain-containing protein [Patescibacteria group bacterium]|nr:S1 RNA-binding domain-containing protein [Patescibacteria group bacterium]